jgi:hypothetical protein
VVANSPATIKYTFSGHFHGTNGAVTARVAGNLREDVTYDNGTVRTCTTNNQSWSATRESQGGDQTLSPPPAGGYSGSSGGYSLTFRVAGGHIQDVKVPASLGCSPGGSLSSEFQLADVTIGTDGTFSATSTVTGVVSGFPAQFTRTFSGRFHGTNSAGTARVNGILREDVTYNNGTARTCTTNNQSWSALRTSSAP